MHKKSTLCLFSVCALILSLIMPAICESNSTSSDPITTVSISPSKIVGPPPGVGQTFAVNVTVQNVTKLFDYDISVSWNPAVLNYSGTVTYFTTFFKGTFGQGLELYSPGLIAGIASSYLSGSGATGSGPLAEIEFQVLNYGFTWINISVSAFLDPQGNIIPYSAVNGSFNLPPPHGPTAVQTYSPLQPRVNKTVTFNASASSPGFNGTANIPIASYRWNFGDGNITTVATSIIYHKYKLAGTYTVNLNVTCKSDPVLARLGLLWNIALQNITIYPPPPAGPKPIETYTPLLRPTINETVTFNASSSLSGWNGTNIIPIASYRWSFGDGNVTTVAYPTINHIYKAAGVYPVNLTVTCRYDPVLAALGLLSNSTWQNITIYQLQYWYWQPGYVNYAPAGVPDFDQRQANWRNPTTGAWSWCGPTAAADALWWLDSKYSMANMPNSFPLIQSYGSWNSLSPKNVQPLIKNLAFDTDTDGIQTGMTHSGTEVYAMASGISSYVNGKGLGSLFNISVLKAPSFLNVEYNLEKGGSIILLLGFWQWNGTNWTRVAGHYVAVAGANPGGMLIGISDPILDTAELGGAGNATCSIVGQTPLTHNNASLVSHDVYSVGSLPCPGGVWDLVNYPAYMMIYDVGENLPNNLASYAGELNYTLPIFTEVEYAVVITPTGRIIQDIHITAVCPTTTQAYPTWPPIPIYVTVKNQGNLTETFTITLYNNTKPISTQPVTNLAPGAAETLTFTWIPYLPGYPNSKSQAWPYPTYTFSANTSAIPGEINPSHNVLTNGTITVKWPGDANGDGHVNGFDLYIMAVSWHQSRGSPLYDPRADFNGDGAVNGFDLYWIAVYWHRGPLD